MARLTHEQLHQAVPNLTGTITVQGLHDSVTILRDPHGIPHVRASCTSDAFFGQGFAHAQDRLWQMDCDRRRAQGRWAEYAGAAGLPQDRLMRRFRLAETARNDYTGASAETRAMLDAYAVGVNAFMATTDRLPAEYILLGAGPEPWQPWDGLAVYKVRHVLMGLWEGKLWRARLVNQVGLKRLLALYPGAQEGELLVLPPGETYHGVAAETLDDLAGMLGALDWLKDDDGGSNNWVVHGSRTVSGKPLLAGDPHRAVEVPGVYYQNHVSCDAFDVAGLSFPGLPAFPHFGHNGCVAWCITHAMADTQDLFVERFDPENPSRYLFRDQWLEARVVTETIHVRGGSPVEERITITHHGPVIAGDPASGQGLAMRYTATLEENRGWNCLLPMLTARTCAELDAVMCDWVDPVNNLLYADVAGNVGYRMRGLVPIRSRANGWLPVPGWTGEHEWQGMIPFAELPHEMNPDCGYIITANNRIVGADYPHYISNGYAPDFRARRIAEHLRGRTDLTAGDMAAIHADVQSLPAVQLQPLLQPIQPRTPQGAAAKALLLEWDRNIRSDSQAAAIYNMLRHELTAAILLPLLGPLYKEAYHTATRGGPPLVTTVRQRIFSLVAANDTTLLPPGATWDSLLTDALEEAAAKAPTRWGLLHQLRPVHPLGIAFPDDAPLLSPVPAEAHGDNDTVQAAGYIPVTGFTVTGSSVARYCFDLSSWEQSGWVVPHGSSGHAGSPHFSDQTPIWLSHRLLPIRYDWGRIEAEAESRQQLQPRK